jgi:hypothetical protein
MFDKNRWKAVFLSLNIAKKRSKGKKKNGIP